MQMEMDLESFAAPRPRRARRTPLPARPVPAGWQLELSLTGPAADLSPARQEAPLRRARAERGRRGHLAGLAAEESVARHYERAGHGIEARRWRGPGGEIDLIVTDGPARIFVEVKAARSFDAAAARLTRRQADRIRRAAEAYCGALPTGLLTGMRFDLALVDERGAVRVIENAFDAP